MRRPITTIAIPHWVYILLLLLCKRCLAGSDSPFGEFLYPTVGILPTYNHIDTLNVTWETFSQNFTSPWLMLYLTTNLAPNFKQILVFNTSVPTNGTLLVPLNYGGPFNLSNFKIQQPDSSFYMSGLFNIQKIDGVEPQTWGVVPRAAATQSPSSSVATVITSAVISISTSTSAVPHAVSRLGTSTPAPDSSYARSSYLPPHILAPILTFLILFFFAALIFCMFLFLKRRRYNALLRQYQTILEERGNAHVGRHAIAVENDGLRGELQGTWQGYELDACAEKEGARAKGLEKDEGQGSSEMG